MTGSDNSTAPNSIGFDPNAFAARHIGPDKAQVDTMLAELQLSSLTDLINKVVPRSILKSEPLSLAEALTEQQALAQLKNLARKNILHKSLLGLGYYDTVTPPVILRNVLENPSWYTAYTPYQPEIAQGRLEGLLNYQQ